ncbi:hypothetical protein [Brevundimonas sp.]|uniref:hypothetical protein n=1 Tax=Brevundimonas sp. TaxID=1871086 RepID=UPI0035669956
MADEKPVFETDEVSATRGREQGLGIGARELAAQRDAGDVQSRDDEDAITEANDADYEETVHPAGNNANGKPD